MIPVPKKNSLRNDSSWSALSFVLIVVSGLVLNAVLAQNFGRIGLGLFNTCLTVVLIVGQLGSLGINSAVAFKVPSAISKGESHQLILKAAMRNVCRTSSVVVISLIVAVELLVSGDESGYLSGLRLIYLAVFLLPLNKVLISFLNGIGDIKNAALANAARFMAMLLCLGAVISLDVSWKSASIVISLAELSLLTWLIWLNRSSLLHSVDSKEDLENQQKSIMHHGVRSIPAVFLSDVNTRIDVLFLSLLKGADVVGQYTVASTFSEGLFQMAMVTRLIVDPRVARLSTTGTTQELSRFLKRHIGLTYAAMVPIIGASIFLYVPVSELLFTQENASGSLEVYLFLATGVLLASGFIPLTNLLNQMGDPLGHSLLLMCLTLVNIAGNLLLIPLMGASGAALATAISQTLFVPLLLVFVCVRKGLNFKKGTR